MSIRSTVKAIIIKDGKILLNRCNDEKFAGNYFSLPGGGQHEYETLHDAVIRECLEETGYSVTPIRLAALCETIFTDEEFRKQNPDCTHRVYHVFLCELSKEERIIPTEKDEMQVSSEWVDIGTIQAENTIRLFPTAVRDNLCAILNETSPLFLGSNYNE
ncbi:MAG: NUDIX domain-containing protein [Defluviitaleaceae bacterium]|nr:NUDIX domain-containing protein [Defluviitaleaceae bacterium]MCL2274681.1 NUDIX domain-containing protein [Defluviitaleaceae bacterium]MCL2275758.1 NUDIX domain-containing protein [Defluviitaleaceae bacterium]